jgi:hypothetical protein
MARRRDAAVQRQWRERLGRYRRSGLTVADFCDLEGVSTASWYVWRRRLAGTRESASRQATPLFVPLAVRGTTGVRIVLPGGSVVELPSGSDERLLKTCIRAAAHLDDDEEEAAAC